MKKLSMALLIALASAAFMTSCGDDKDDNKGGAAPAVDACASSKVCDNLPDNGAVCDKVADASAEGGCKAVYSCPSGYVNLNNSNGPDIDCAPEAACANTVCNEVANADGVASGEDCACSYTCKDAYDRIDDASAAKGFKCLLKNDEICNGNDECASGNCESVDEETSKCAPAGTNPGPVDECDPSNANACSDGKLCIKNACKTADDLDHTECSPSTDSDYCFGNVKVNCLEVNGVSQYSKESCTDGAECVVSDRIASCVLPTVDPDECTEANADAVIYSCSGDEVDDSFGGYSKSIEKKCTQGTDGYAWVETVSNCTGGDACYPKHASSKCLNTLPNEQAIGADCFGKDFNCASDFCDPDTNKCAEKSAD